MKYEYIFYIEDRSFDYGDFPGAVYYDITYHGFSIDIDRDDRIDMKTLKGYGDYSCMSDIKTWEELKTFLSEHLDEVWDAGEVPREKNIEVFKELIEIVKENIEVKDEHNKLQRGYDYSSSLCN